MTYHSDRELMQMALDALEAMQSYARAEKKGLRICDESIEALRERLAQPEPEPIAWMVYTEDGQDAYITSNPHDIKNTEKAFPLWAYPKEWVGLTDEEIEECKINGGLPHAINWRISVKVMQAKLKEKNS